MEKGGYIYILTTNQNTALYTGVTANLKNRIWEHKTKVNPKSFTSRYNIHKLVYFEGFNHIIDAIAREKQIKAGSRAAKIKLIEKINPGWKELFDFDNEF